MQDFSYKDVEEGDAIVLFSKKKVLSLAEEYSEKGIKASIIYGDLPPEVRRKQYDDFINKETKILITTDAIGMGVNLPIRRIVFLSVKKFCPKLLESLKPCLSLMSLIVDGAYSFIKFLSAYIEAVKLTQHRLGVSAAYSYYCAQLLPPFCRVRFSGKPCPEKVLLREIPAPCIVGAVGF